MSDAGPAAAAPRVVSTLATTPPAARVYNPFFWMRPNSFNLAVFGGGAALLWVYEFALQRVSAGVELFLGLVNLGLWSWAALSASATLSTLEVNQALARHVYREGEAFLRSLRAKQESRLPLDELSVRFLPSNPARPALARMFEQIVEQAKDRQFNFSGNVVRLFREESVHEVAGVERLQQLTLRLGILGTFIGLGAAMYSIPGGLESILPQGAADDPSMTAGALAANRREFVELAQRLTGALSDAFATSISGLACSAGIWTMAYVLRRKQFSYFSDLDRAAEIVTSLSRNALNVDEFHEHFQQLILKLDELKTQLYDRVSRLSQNVVELDARVTDQTSIIDSGLHKLKAAGGELDAFLKRLSLDQTQVLRNLELLFERAELRRAFERLEQSVEEAGNALGGKLALQANAVLERSESWGDGLTQVNGRLTQVAQGMERLVSSLSELSTRVTSLKPPAVVNPSGPSSPGRPQLPGGVRSLAMLMVAGALGSVTTLLLERALQ